MEGDIFTDENGFYQIDFTHAIWVEGSLNQKYRAAKIELSDVDWIAELNDHIVFIEYKNSNVPGASNPGSFDPTMDEHLKKVARKYYDSLHILKVMKKGKRIRYIYIVEAPIVGSSERLMVRNKLQAKLPFLLQVGMKDELINNLLVLSIEEWNNHANYSVYPLTPCTPETLT